MQLQQYLKRINYSGVIEPSLEVLRLVHRCHVYNLSYENIDVVMQTPVSMDTKVIFEKIVVNGRGGWCYEMNGLLAWALGEMGFAVNRFSGGVLRSARGDAALGNHLVLRVDLDGPWLADVGLGDGLVEPISLQAGEHIQGHRCFQLEQRSSGEWRFHNRAGAMPPDYDFYDDVSNEIQLDTACEKLQSDPESLFRQNLICQRLSAAGGWSLLGRVLTNLDNGKRCLIESEQELVNVLSKEFELKVPEITGLWDKVVDRHQTLFGDKPVEEIRFGPPVEE